ncbi:CsaB [Paenibacillus mucilaginosus 3016]|uniref:CsaB n=1 Tax=Paenibacillus mucilaginosus 3016 TaxID=1116391 RepID=H6NT56_9BACL|nr:polysaccharide pyruvyl transferase CsaB [Paenibacillus mucilaginosus]AFC27069.1 CsaB [Paenibacillus mucilaginosus 3016]WFA16003.1 polysaccharide pyruvyl transferase CsaB [Paenibacillus mucilaginosus]
MGTPVKRIVLSGYYGFNNSGDEAVLQSILLALQEQGERQGVTFHPVVLSVNPAETARTYGVESAHRMRPMELWKALRGADGLISGGGSLLQDETSPKTIPYYLGVIRLAQLLGKPVFVYSQGIGPVHRPKFFGWIRSAFQRCRVVTVRDEESKALLQQMGLSGSEVEVVPDPVMGMPLKNAARHRDPAGADSGLAPVIGVSVRFWNKDRSELDAAAEALRKVMEETDAVVRFLPFHLPSDEEASEYVAQRLGETYKHRISIAKGVTHPQDMLAETASVSVLLGMRLHSLIYAAGRYVPMVGISYDPKIDQFLNRLSMQAACSTQAPNAAAIAETLLHLLKSREAWREDKRQVIERLKSEAHRPAERIAAFYSKAQGRR